MLELLMENLNSLKQELLKLLCEHSYIKGEVILASGRKSDFYIDCRKTVLLANGHKLVGEIFHKLVMSHFPDAQAVGGVVLGACPIASAVSFASWNTENPMPAFYLRKESKTHGLGNLLEGPINKGDKVVILEDVVTSGGSTLKAIQSAKDQGLEVLGVITLIDRQEDNGAEKINSVSPFYSVFTKDNVQQFR
jgi:orotate phosphoribosyltransferase